MYKMAEEWRSVKDYEGKYEVSDKGNVRSVDREILQPNSKNGKPKVRKIKGKMLCPTDNGSGYLIVGLGKKSGGKNHYVHRLVAEAFIGDIPEGMAINHKDYNRQNNSVENLEICTVRENIMHSLPRMKHQRENCKPTSTGEKYITQRNNRFRVQLRINGETMEKNFKTIEDAVLWRNEMVKNYDKINNSKR